ncbi:hypothetical protein EW146_g2347 [Bondarzewia mesenterica]|uniref:Uncharacterized protein n=1 Tax=Bondarzewia mesenterica TaxID=1095465 RepID=A0A4S4M1F2_9AGAM|nr:hypothetical protein EW146_g2347 [Bondarzewia mesenterica]
MSYDAHFHTLVSVLSVYSDLTSHQTSSHITQLTIRITLTFERFIITRATMAPTTRSRKRKEPTFKPKSASKSNSKTRKKTSVYVLIDKTPRNRTAVKSSNVKGATEEPTVKRKPRGRAKAKAEVEVEDQGDGDASRSAKVSSTNAKEEEKPVKTEISSRTRAKGKGKAKANIAEPAVASADLVSAAPPADAASAVLPQTRDLSPDESPPQPTHVTNTVIVEGIPTPSQSPHSSPEPSPLPIFPLSIEPSNFVFSTPPHPISTTFKPPTTPHRDLSIRGHLPSSLPPSSPIPYTSSPDHHPAPLRHSYGTAPSFSVYTGPGALNDNGDLVAPDSQDESDFALPIFGEDDDKENQALWSEEDKENQIPEEEEDKENAFPESEEDKENRFSVFRAENLFSPGLKRKRDVEGDDEMVNSVPMAEEFNPFDVGVEDDSLTTDSDKENAHTPVASHYRSQADDEELEIPAPSSDQHTLQPRPPTPSQLHYGKRQKVLQDEDPFGFFAAETKLKARRLAEAGPSSRPLLTRQPLGVRSFAIAGPSTETLPAATSSALPPSRIYSGYSGAPSTPTRRDVLSTPHTPWTPRVGRQEVAYEEDDLEDLYMTPPEPHLMRTPRTPRLDRVVDDVMTPRHGGRRNEQEITMRRRKRKESQVRSEVDESVDGSSELLVSSPSPVKRRSSAGSAAKVEEAQEDGERPKKRSRESVATAKEKGKGKAKEVRDEDPKVAMIRLEEMLPKRRSRREVPARAAKSNPPVHIESTSDEADTHRSDEEELEKELEKEGGRGRGRSKSRGTRGTRARGRGRGRSRSEGSRGRQARRKPAEVSTDEEVREKREKERLTRIEYFKKLDGYEVAKENVYVI